LFLNLLQLDVGKRANTVVDTAAAAVLETGVDAVPEVEADATAVVEENFMINVSSIFLKFYNL